MERSGNRRIRALSKQASSLWGKSDYGEGERWLPLFVHMLDAAEIAGCLWDSWVPEGTRGIVAEALGGDAELARKTYVFLAGVHDMGKATPYFQLHSAWNDADAIPSWKPSSAGLSGNLVIGAAKPPSHSVASDVVLRSLLSGTFDELEYVSLGAIVGNHHGVPPTSEKVQRSSEVFEAAFGLCAEDWASVQRELLQLVEDYSGLDAEALLMFEGLVLPAQVESVLSGLVILSDWLSSNQDLFPLLELLPEDEESRAIQSGHLDASWFDERAEEGWDRAGLAPCWSEDLVPDLTSDAVFRQRFHLPDSYGARPVQEAAARIATDCSNPGIILIEAPTGEGKTEAALEAAEVLAVREGRGGVMIALPTMATTDAMFGRVRSWLETLPQSAGLNAKSTYLAHGKARLNEEFQELVHEAHHACYDICPDENPRGTGTSEPRGDAIVSEWFTGRKRGLLSNFVVCTIDQVLMSALQMKHVSLRQLSLANKVVIIDECHAYDAYMLEYLKRTLEWLGSWNSPVILLSATLPPRMKKDLLGAYLQGKSCSCGTLPEPKTEAIGAVGYPMVTYSDGLELRSTKVRQASESVESDIRLIGDSDQELLDLLTGLLEDGGCAGVICDTVRRAQDAYRVLVEAFGEENVFLIHSRFLDIDRMEKESILRDELGPRATRSNGGRPHLRIVVGTQVLEQSLDIDFDVLVSDIAPIDLLIQRLGRSHRHAVHDPERPKRLSRSVCYLRGIEDWKDGAPTFSKGIGSIYESAALFEALGVLEITEVDGSAAIETPHDVPALIRDAYEGIEGNLLPSVWAGPYALACKKRDEHVSKKKADAQSYLLRSVGEMDRRERSIEDWFAIGLKSDERHGSRAVRDTDEALEVIVLEDDGKGLRLLPWVGNEQEGIEPGEEVPLDSTPSYQLACAISESAVRIPKGVLRTVEEMEKAIEELEDACSSRLGAWEDSGMLAGQLVMAMHRDPSADDGFEATLCGKRISYSRTVGLISSYTQ